MLVAWFLTGVLAVLVVALWLVIGGVVAGDWVFAYRALVVTVAAAVVVTRGASR